MSSSWRTGRVGKGTPRRRSCGRADLEVPLLPGSGLRATRRINEVVCAATRNRARDPRTTAYRRSSNAFLGLGPYRKTAKSLSNEITREMPSRSMTAKDVRSTIEKSWSGKRSPIDHAASKSTPVVCLFDSRDTTSQAAPKCARCASGDEVVEETPGLDHDVISNDQRFGRLEESLCSGVVPVSPISGGMPSRAVHKDTHDSSQWLRFPALIASAIIRSLCDAISLPQAEPRSKTRERSTLRGGSIRSRAKSRRMYSANETPHLDARARTWACNSDVMDIWVLTVMMAPS